MSGFDYSKWKNIELSDESDPETKMKEREMNEVRNLAAIDQNARNFNFNDFINEYTNNKNYQTDSKIIKYSNTIYNNYMTYYKKELNSIENAKNVILNPKCIDVNKNNDINYLYSHLIPYSIMLDIFGMLCCKGKNRGNKLENNVVITLQYICKNWRILVMENEYLFEGIMYSIVKPSWKLLVLTPKKYLKYLNNYMIDVFDVKYKDIFGVNLLEKYFELIEFKMNSDDEACGFDINYYQRMQMDVFLLIKLLPYAPNIYNINFSGELCDEVFYIIGKYCNNLTKIDLSHIQHGNPHWFRHLTNNDNINISMKELILDRASWISDDELKYFSKFKNIFRINMDRLHMITPMGLQHIFKNCSNLHEITLSRALKNVAYNSCNNKDMLQAIKDMIYNCDKLVYIQFNECELFNDDCLQLMMPAYVLPNLKELEINHTNCTFNVVQQFKQSKPDINVHFYQNDF